MVISIKSCALEGMQPRVVIVECDMTNGLPAMSIVGVNQKAAEGIRERVRASIQNCGLEFPRKRISINVAPTDIAKDGALYDLPIALAVLARSGQIDPSILSNLLAVGELGLDGSIRAVRGVLAISQLTKKLGLEFIAPTQNEHQLALLETHLRTSDHLQTLYRELTGLSQPTLTSSRRLEVLDRDQPSVDMSDIIGQDHAKRAIEIAAAGNHNILMTGPPGTGKSMLGQALVGILPPMSRLEMLESTQIHSLATSRVDEVITQRPFRSPHHSSSHIALVGGGQYPRPGEISLSHNGVLFLDELPEFSKQSLESLRQPLEDRVIHVSRANLSVTYPAKFMLVATKNPCPCGYYGDPKRACQCTLQEVVRYHKRVSGPIMDRIDLTLNVERVEADTILQTAQRPKTSHQIAQRVSRARSIQEKRLGAGKTNSIMSTTFIRSRVPLDDASRQLMHNATERLGLSTRAFFRIVKVARTIADLEASDRVTAAHIAEALQYRLPEQSVAMISA